MKLEKYMKPFIFIYHFVRFIFLLPFTILKYAYTGILAIVDKLTNGNHIQKNIELKYNTTNNKANNNNINNDSNKEDNIEDMIPEGIISMKKDNLVDLGKKTSFRYVVKSPSGQTIKSKFDAYSIEEVYNFLKNEGYQVVSVEPRKPYDIDIMLNRRMKSADLAFTLTQLSTYIKAGIPLIDSVRILAKQSTKQEKRIVYENIVYELLKGENFSTALERQDGVFPRLLVNMVKTSEMTGDLASTLDDMSDYYTSMAETRKQMISAMTYPLVIFVAAVAVVIFILTFVVPRFIEMFENQDAALPWITKLVIFLSDFIKTNYLGIIIAVLVIIIIFYGLYKNIKAFKKTVQTILMKTPMIGNIIIYNEVTTFTKTFASLLNHSVFITDSMTILSQLTDNEIYKKIINRSLVNLSKGAKISESFKGQWAFPIVAYEMLVTGENTGQLGLMMEKVSEHYQSLHRNAVNQMKSLIEPIMIAFLAVIVGGIILSIIIPMFELYNEIR